MIIPQTVLQELHADKAPLAVQAWIAARPPWLQVAHVHRATLQVMPETLDPGERAALAFARHLHAALLIMADQAGRREAHRWHVTVTGTLGVLYAAARGL